MPKGVEVMAKWDEKDLRAGDFKLKVKEGDIKKGEIIGIIGRNALGKSTFANDLFEEGLGDENPMSYKPQMIPRNDDEQVEFDLMQYKNYTDNFYQVYVLEPLNISSIAQKPIKTLSGGELQRYAIAKCLLSEAQVYIIDEPTAFLDVEDRLKIAKIIKNFIQMREKSAFIIDHDLVFMDYLSDKLLVFQGEVGVKGFSSKPLSMRDGMNLFLKDLDITFRRDSLNKRPRVNKDGSVNDQKQKALREYYYV